MHCIRCSGLWPVDTHIARSEVCVCLCAVLYVGHPLYSVFCAKLVELMSQWCLDNKLIWGQGTMYYMGWALAPPDEYDELCLVVSDDAALCQITLTSCFIVNLHMLKLLYLTYRCSDASWFESYLVQHTVVQLICHQSSTFDCLTTWR